MSAVGDDGRGPAAFERRTTNWRARSWCGHPCRAPEPRAGAPAEQRGQPKDRGGAGRHRPGAAYKQPINIEFRDAPLKQMFEVISRRSGLNFLFDKDVKTDQRTSIFLKNSTVEAAVYYLLVTNQLEQQVMDGNTVLVYPNIAAKQKEYQEMTVKTFFLANADAKAVATRSRPSSSRATWWSMKSSTW
jgi:type II secretory pathway component HofQ